LYISNKRVRRSRQALKTMLVYLSVSGFCVFFNAVYSLYGHGVSSAAMSLMFLYPLLGGALGFGLVWLTVPAADGLRHYRAVYNLYNSGLATLILGSALQGVLEIAGTTSPYIALYRIAGGVLAGVGLLGFWRSVHRRRRAFCPMTIQRKPIDSLYNR